MTELQDGEYKIEASLTGGSGKARIGSPLNLSVKDGVMTADIEWSSPNYDYMELNSKSYYPVNDGGNSVFEIEIPSLDVEIPVKAETTAMSQPHMIEYSLLLDSSTVKKESGFNYGIAAAGIAIVVAAAVSAASVRRVIK